MNRVLLQEAIKLNKERKRKKNWQKVVRFLAAGVVFTTTYALILPAITMNRETVCGLEAHTHGPECYGLRQAVDQCPYASHVHSDECRDDSGALVCGYGEQVIHSHNEFCYDASGALVCDMEEISEHIHDDACCAQSSELVCTIPESPAHVHDEQCQAEPVLVCGLTEGEVHVHGEDCCRQTSELVCTEAESEEHTHGEACYETGTELVCTYSDSEPHVHGESCYEAGENVCTLEETEGHTHTEACCQTVTGLICQKPQVAVHTHSEECRDENGELVCQIIQGVVHDHTDACFDQNAETQEVLICTMEEHTHDESCYLEDTGASETEYLCGYGAHAHGPECTDADGNLICNIPEHTHEAACLVEDLDMTADVETREQWEAELNALSYTGVWAEDVLTIAKSQLGYQESRKNVILDENGVLRGYTRYGEWYGDHYGDWCGMFVSFCLHYAGVDGFPQESSCTEWIALLQEQELYRPAAEYTPKPGDVIFFDWDQPVDAQDADHVGIVAELIPATEETPAQIRTIEGNSTEQVEYKTYNADDVTILGYGELPQQVFYCARTAHTHTDGCYDAAGEASCGMEAHVHSELCWNLSKNFEVNGRALECSQDHEHTDECYGEAVAYFTYEDEDVTMKITATSSVGIPKGVQLEVTGLTDEEYLSYADYAEANAAGALTGMTGYRFRFLLAGEEIELEDTRITVELTLNGVSAGEDSGAEVMTAESGDDVLVVNQGASGGENAVLYSTRSASTDEEGESAGEADGGSSDTQSTSAGTISVLGQEDGSVTTLDTMETSGGEQTVTVSLGSSRSIALMSANAPEFTVEYYANFPKFQYSETQPDGTYLEIIDTRGSGDGTGGSLPYNAGSITETGTTRGKLYLKLQDTGRTNEDRVSSAWSGFTGSSANRNTYGTAVYEVMTVDTLTKVYRSEDYTYSSGMNIHHLDSLHENTHYELTQVWVSTDGGSTWTAYTESADDVTADGYKINKTVHVDEIHDMEFTNNSGNTENVYIQDNGLVRMVYELVEGTQYVSANMFDYDISNGNVYVYTTKYVSYETAKAARDYVSSNSNDNGKIYMRTVNSYGNNLGINNVDSYVTTDSGAYLAFGNSNTGVTYSAHKRAGAYINQANRANSNSTGGFKYCHFGLVTDYNILHDTLVYASGINHQALFNDEAYYMSQDSSYTIEGKTSYYRQRLDFTRTGDTYVLSAVNGGNDALGTGVSAGNLDEFNYTYQLDRTDLLSNNFWPMDGTAGDTVEDKDMMFGEASDYNSKFRMWYNADTGTTGTLPVSDDGFAHNSYFGMQFSVEFALDGKYCGPLEYLFYGDDDMWVFLTDIETGESQLICDIGGVHSSVGSFTDLWDYIPADSTKTYRLTFFYTERGASGSTCYMEFTLPQVTSITQNTPTTGSVTVGKEAVNESTVDAEYTFRFELAASASVTSGVNDNYSYEIEGSGETRTGTITSGGTITMKADETFTVMGIPEGLVYTVTEVFAEGKDDAYNVSWVQDANATVSGASVTGTIEAAKTHSFTATNQAAGSLELKKEIVGTPTDQNFRFIVTLADADGDPISGTYGGNTFDAEGKLTVTIQQDQTVTLTNLPVGAVWTVVEESVDGYRVTYKVDGTEVETATGTVAHDQTATVTVVNATEYSLPNTGGTGAETLTFGGLLITAAAIMYICDTRRKRRKGGVYKKN